MAKIDQLVENYGRQVALPWQVNLAGPQRVWFAVYEKTDERRLRARLGEFEVRTRQAGHGWLLHDCTDAFAHWMTGHKYRESYFEEPEHLVSALASFQEYVASRLRDVLTGEAAGPNTVVAVHGLASLFGLLRVSDLVNAVQAAVRGRLLVFFPGEYDNNNYRFLDARDGWNYLAIPITPYQGASPE